MELPCSNAKANLNGRDFSNLENLRISFGSDRRNDDKVHLLLMMIGLAETLAPMMADRYVALCSFIVDVSVKVCQWVSVKSSAKVTRSNAEGCQSD